MTIGGALGACAAGYVATKILTKERKRYKKSKKRKKTKHKRGKKKWVNTQKKWLRIMELLEY